MPVRGDHPELRALVFQGGVGGDGGAVREAGNPAEIKPGRLHRRDHTACMIIRCRRRLQRGEIAALGIVGYQISEGAGRIARASSSGGFQRVPPCV